MKENTIAIDGPAGAGKSTVAKLVAKKLGYVYIDTGAMYRAVAWKVLKENDNKIKNENISDDFIISISYKIDIALQYIHDTTCVSVDGIDITEEIRTPDVTAIVSHVARLARVREKMVSLQREMGKKGAVVMDGRDIASNVLPDADVKIFLTASIDERAHRRFLEMKEKGYSANIDEIKRDIAARDKADSEREVSPLVCVPEADVIDTSDMTIEGVVNKILEICKK